jgi:hypothetical protein
VCVACDYGSVALSPHILTHILNFLLKLFQGPEIFWQKVQHGLKQPLPPKNTPAEIMEYEASKPTITASEAGFLQGICGVQVLIP